MPGLVLITDVMQEAQDGASCFSILVTQNSHWGRLSLTCRQSPDKKIRPVSLNRILIAFAIILRYT